MAGRTDTKVVNFRMKPKAFREFEECVSFKGTSVSDLLRRFVRKWVKKVSQEMASTKKRQRA